MMPAWQVALVLNLTFVIALGLGYAGWGRRADKLDRELDAARIRVERLERQRQACAAGARAGEQQWEGRGIVRAVYPQLLVITHEEISGLLPGRTTSFPVSARGTRVGLRAGRGGLRAGGGALRVGDAIRFSLRGTAPDDAAVVAVDRW